MNIRTGGHRTMMAKRVMQLLAVAALLAQAMAASSTCTTNEGALQLVPRGTSDSSYCFPEGDIILLSRLLPLCASAFAVTSSGNKLFLSPAASNTIYPVAYEDFKTMRCSNFNATGVVNATKDAEVTFFYDITSGSGPSRLTATSPGLLTLTTGYNNCQYTYKVISGCVLGVKAITPTPACPPGTYLQESQIEGLSTYCALCPPGQESTSPPSLSCSPCKPGTKSSYYGTDCSKCDDGYYTPKNGTMYCEFCGTENQQYTDGLTCKACPADSARSTTNSAQCVACGGGKRCCRTNADANCPRCATNFKSSTASGSFALVGASAPSCLLTPTAACTSKLDVTITGQCQVVINTLVVNDRSNISCYGSTSVMVNTGGAIKLTSLPPITTTYVSNDFIFTSTSAPFLTTSFLPSPRYSDSPSGPNCTLTYRALSGNLPAQVGVAPKPCPPGKCTTSKGTCSGGSYVAKDSTGRYKLCLPCPPGTFTRGKAVTSRSCKACPEGTSTVGFGGSACVACPAGTFATPGMPGCSPCLGGTYSTGKAAQCTQCPTGSFALPDPAPTHCLINNYGTLCCAEGDCKGKPACPANTYPRSADDGYPALFQLSKTSGLSARKCKGATALTCLASKSMLEVRIGSFFRMRAVNQPKCNMFYSKYPYTGIITSYNQAQYLNNYGDGQYTITSSAKAGTITIAYNPSPSCSATFKLVTGYAFDLSPPSSANCPTGSVPSTQGGRKMCSYCEEGTYPNAKGSCVECPVGYANAILGMPSCTKCPANTYSDYPRSSYCNDCLPGTYSAGGAARCTSCPKNTYRPSGGVKCNTCPSGMVSPQQSSSQRTSFCYVPFPSLGM